MHSTLDAAYVNLMREITTHTDGIPWTDPRCVVRSSALRLTFPTLAKAAVQPSRPRPFLSPSEERDEPGPYRHAATVGPYPGPRRG